jgi:aminotransferase
MLEKIKQNAKAVGLSGFREVMALAATKGCINLGPGFCTLSLHPRVLEAAQRAIASQNHYYTECDGIPPLKAAIAERYGIQQEMTIAPENVVVTCGATGAFESVCKCFLGPGDEVVMFDPFYQYHARQVTERGATVRYVRLSPPGWSFSVEDVERAITAKTVLLVFSNPNNPTGKVFSRDELVSLGNICRKAGVIMVCDEVYEYLVTPSHRHVSMASIPGMFDHTLTLSSAGKTFQVTGWRVGWLTGPSSVIGPIAVKADETYLCAPAPLQYAVADCMKIGADFFEDIQWKFEKKRRLIFSALQAGGFTPYVAEGAFYVLAGYEKFGYRNDVEALRGLVNDFGVLALPGSVFSPAAASTGMLRFCFAVEDTVLEKACDQLASGMKSKVKRAYVPSRLHAGAS